jgi:hypothetical protein
MRRTATVFFALLLIIASFISGCSSLPSSGTTPQETHKPINTSFSGNYSPGGSQRLRFEPSAADLASTDLDAGGNTTTANVSREKHIKGIRGTDLDENGDAASWTFIIEQNARIFIVSYTQQGVTSSSGPGTIQQDEIFPARIIPPRELFEKNRAVIFNTTGQDTPRSLDLSLSRGYYSLTISGRDTSHTMVFDAKTGVLNP